MPLFLQYGMKTVLCAIPHGARSSAALSLAKISRAFHNSAPESQQETGVKSVPAVPEETRR